MYADYLVHFNKNHDPKTGQFTFGKNITPEQKANKEFYRKERKLSFFKPSGNSMKYYVEHPVLNKVVENDKKLRLAKNQLEEKRNSKEVEKYANDKFEKKRGYKFNPERPWRYQRVYNSKTKEWSETDEKLFGSFLAKAILKYEKQYDKELERAAKEFAGKYSEKKVQNFSKEYYKIIKSALNTIVEDTYSNNHEPSEPIDREIKEKYLFTNYF